MIVKIQISQFSSTGNIMMLIYNKSRSVEYKEVAPEELIKLMKGAPKKIFNASMVKDVRPGVKGRLIKIEEEAPWQDW